jgi:hypothetical protein
LGNRRRFPQVVRNPKKTSTKSPKTLGDTPENERLAALESVVKEQQRNYERDAATLNRRLSFVEERRAKDRNFDNWLIAGILFLVGAVVPLSVRNFGRAQARREAYRFIERWNSIVFENISNSGLLPCRR